MASKLVKMPAGGHTAGIFADMSVDGPEIGTLVAIFDRAKNLPNRKTMGKQNPYCAARLAKEAKKTDTDMRGGQTPKWDQELRFTVHQSPDYYQLKVSVFNDDKKTDLIGETWVDLRGVIVAGGGQSDQWHGLQCKGKYAGDIRIELTYYDARPKDEAVIERRKEEKAEAKADAARTLSGPRQAKAPKRRPLPADPTGATPPRPSTADDGPITAAEEPPPPAPLRRPPPAQPPVAQQQQQQQQPPPPPPPPPEQQSSRVYETPDDFHRQWAPSNPAAPPPNPAPQHPYETNPPRHAVQPPPVDVYDPHPPQPTHPPLDQQYAPPPEFHQSAALVTTSQLFDAPPNTHHYPPEQNIPYGNDAYEPQPRQQNHHVVAPDHHYSMPPTYPTTGGSRGSHYTTTDPHARTASEISTKSRRHHGSGELHGHYHRYSNAAPPNNDHYIDDAGGSSVHPSDFHSGHGYMQPQVQDEEDEGPPPPPPVHRAGIVQKLPPEPSYHQPSEPVPMPKPLSFGPGRRSPNISDADQQTYVAYSPNYSSSAYPPPEPERQVYSTSPTPSYRSYAGQRDRAYPPVERPVSSNGELVPAALVAGCSPNVVDDPEPPMYEPRHERRQSNVAIQQIPSQQLVRTSPAPVDRPSPRTTPDPRVVPPRKSVSPHPPPLQDPGTLSGVPFSPDSYDALNPGVGNSSALQQPPPAYDSPEGAMEAARQREVEKLRDLGPIIGNDGRVIDPTDHLPTDTWAPEPERKPRKPEVVVRFKHSTMSSRSSTREQKPATTRPHSVIAASYSQRQSQVVDRSSPAAPASQSSVRTRLQKQSGRPQSYIQPSTSRQEQTPPRTSQALRERENLSTYSSSSHSAAATPSYHSAGNSPYHHQPQGSPSSAVSRHSPSTVSRHYQTIGPPIPAKVPIHPGNQNYPASGPGAVVAGTGELDALSEEMKRIDIGVGKRRARISYTGSYE
ncbi:hypothetical protein AJ80_06668 [Polytolypa hystricis UAMH7299]|uniref:C2 domain-containing protein n=1 Tax=Polytolypa hystricis (strain UAMH7299) TaxID=1447883 RepID=A0A2B7XUG5_POLH7|nr:hypothetical protein AJ80_06668 [Polytolypa hystricis UAMH7299]